MGLGRGKAAEEVRRRSEGREKSRNLTTPHRSGGEKVKLFDSKPLKTIQYKASEGLESI